MLENEVGSTAELELREEAMQFECTQRRFQFDGVLVADEAEVDVVVLGGGRCRLRVLEDALLVESRVGNGEWTVKHEIGL